MKPQAGYIIRKTDCNIPLVFQLKTSKVIDKEMHNSGTKESQAAVSVLSVLYNPDCALCVGLFLSLTYQDDGGGTAANLL